jgi:hypothetical protein
MLLTVNPLIIRIKKTLERQGGYMVLFGVLLDTD